MCASRVEASPWKSSLLMVVSPCLWIVNEAMRQGRSAGNEHEIKWRRYSRLGFRLLKFSTCSRYVLLVVMLCGYVKADFMI